MKGTILCAAVTAAAIAMAAPAQARMADPGLRTAAPAVKVEPVRSRHHSRRHRRGAWDYYAYSSRRWHRPHWTCWYSRERVWRHRWRLVRHCGWRYR